LLRIIGAAALLAASVAGAAACGDERRLVGAAADRNAALIADFARPAGIADLATLVAPSRPDERSHSRFLPTELTVYEVSGLLRTVERLPDGDYRLVVADPDHQDSTIFAVSVDPACVSASRFAANIVAVRHTLDRQFAGFSRLEPNQPVTVTGIAFFAKRHGQAGAAPNGVELRPLIGVAFP
jgi:hypothetical protein